MIQTNTFALSKDKAQLAHGGLGRQRYYYLGDVKSQWESSNVPSKALELIGAESGSVGQLPALKTYLGPLSTSEQRFMADASAFLFDLSKLVSTLPPAINPELDLCETVLDARLLKQHIKFPCRVLDIGPGAGRHLLNLMLRPDFAGSSYCAVDSIGLPYALQNLMAGMLAVRDSNVSFIDTVEAEFARQDVVIPEHMPPGSIWHAPLWHADKLPSGGFDLIICNYVLDEVPAEDFRNIMALISRSLAPEGVVYCRGGQQKSMLRDLHLYGYGTYHQQDITAAFLSAGFKATDCQLIAGAITRIFVRSGSRTHLGAEIGYSAFRSDVPLIDAVQKEFIREHIDRIKAQGLRTLIWSDPGHAAALRYISDVASEIDICGVTNDHIYHEVPSILGWREYPLNSIRDLKPQAVILATNKLKLAIRELSENLAGVGPLQSFNYPIAFSYF
jgi:SAM-dependent methyltransferase